MGHQRVCVDLHAPSYEPEDVDLRVYGLYFNFLCTIEMSTQVRSLPKRTCKDYDSRFASDTFPDTMQPTQQPFNLPFLH